MLKHEDNKHVIGDSGRYIKTLVLDAGPLLTQPASALQQTACDFYTTPGVYSELRDEAVRRQLLLWGDQLKVRHPKPESIQKVSRFAKLTGDYAVLSINDIAIMALAYELECELNGGDWRLRRYPGEQLKIEKKNKSESQEYVQRDSDEHQQNRVVLPVEKNEDKKSESKKNEGNENDQFKKPRRRGGKKQREKRAAQGNPNNQSVKTTEVDTENDLKASERKPDFNAEIEPLSTSLQNVKIASESEEGDHIHPHEENLSQEFDENEDDGEWITPENFLEEILKDKGETQDSTEVAKPTSLIKVALTTGDFACQNVAMQMGINLMNAMSGKQIKRLRNYMYRCHACFRLTPMPKDGRPKHFCPKCGGNTLLRCAVSVDRETGRVTPHLKANFQWIKRGEVYSLPSPFSKNQKKLQGNAGFQHNKHNRDKSLQNPLILREDQKEYQKAIKNEQWQRKQSEKMLEEWVGGGSAENFVSPFTTSNSAKTSGIRVGKGRYANDSKGRRK